MPHDRRRQRLYAEAVRAFRRSSRRTAPPRSVQTARRSPARDGCVPENDQAAGPSCRMGPHDGTAMALTLSDPSAFRPECPRMMPRQRSEEHTSELQSLMRISYAVFCLKKKNKENTRYNQLTTTTSTHNQRHIRTCTRP